MIPEVPTTLKERNQLLVWAEEQEQTAAIFAAGGTVPDPSKASPKHAERCAARAADYRRRAAMYVRDVEGE